MSITSEQNVFRRCGYVDLEILAFISLMITTRCDILAVCYQQGEHESYLVHLLQLDKLKQNVAKIYISGTYYLCLCLTGNSTNLVMNEYASTRKRNQKYNEEKQTLNSFLKLKS